MGTLTARSATGTDHRLFRLGDALLARMPKIAWAADQAASDARWLPGLAPRLSLAVPVPVPYRARRPRLNGLTRRAGLRDVAPT